MTTPPPSNLGPLSEPWARYITEQVRGNQTAIERLGGDLSNTGAQSNSGLNLVSSQINELMQRQSGLVTAADASVTLSSGLAGTSVQIQVPRPSDKARIGWLSVQVTARNSNSLQSEAYVSYSLDGSVFHRDSRYLPTDNLEPASWNGDKAITGYTAFIASPGSGGLLNLDLQAEAAFSTGARTVTFANIRVTYQYGQAA